jgi:hypothetical protein
MEAYLLKGELAVLALIKASRYPNCKCNKNQKLKRMSGIYK